MYHPMVNFIYKESSQGIIPASYKFHSVSEISLTQKDLTRVDNIFGKTLDFYPLEIIAKIGDVTHKETVENDLYGTSCAT